MKRAALLMFGLCFFVATSAQAGWHHRHHYYYPAYPAYPVAAPVFGVPSASFQLQPAPQFQFQVTPQLQPQAQQQPQAQLSPDAQNAIMDGLIRRIVQELIAGGFGGGGIGDGGFGDGGIGDGGIGDGGFVDPNDNAGQLAAIRTELGALKSRVSAIDTRVDGLSTKIQSHDQQLAAIQKDLQKLKKSLKAKPAASLKKVLESAEFKAAVTDAQKPGTTPDAAVKMLTDKINALLK